MSFAQRIAAVVMITLGALTLYVVFALFNSLAPSVAFADVAQKIKSARTLVFMNTVTLPGKEPIATRTLMAEPDRQRQEQGSGGVTIIVGTQALVLNPGTHTAIRMDMSGATTRPGAQASAVQALRSLGDSKGEAIGEQTIDGTPARGFRTKIGSQVMTVWADAKTALPVRIETAVPMGAGEARVVMDQFEIDPPLDDALFSLDPPAGYTLSSHKIDIGLDKPEQAVINLLRLYAERSGGSFPKKINDPQEYAEVFKTRIAATTNPSDPEVLDMAAKLGGGFGTVFSLINQSTTGYAGDGVKLGEKEKIVFWFKPHESEKYRAIFGDLHVEDVTADRLPATQPAAK